MMTYENARRAGRTHPDLVEMIERTDPRHRSHQVPPANNRRNRRAAGMRHRVNVDPQPRNPVPRSVRRAEARRQAKSARP